MEIQVWLGEDVLEAFVIGENLTMAAQQLLEPCYQSMYHRCKFKIMCGIVELMLFQLTRSIRHNLAFLHEDST